MKYSYQTIEDFRGIFSGNDKAYGVYHPPKSKEGNKEQGKCYTKEGIITESIIINHLNGNTGLGIIPIEKDNKTNFVVIDIDEYVDIQILKDIVEVIYAHKMPLIPFCSKSGGLHIYCFFSKPVNSKKAIDMMKRFLGILGLKNNTEVFPKQVNIKDKIGSWINLPYFGDTRKMYDKNFNYIDILIAIDSIKKSKVALEELELFFANMVLSDAPPCLQTIYLFGKSKNRNHYLFSLACYYKAKLGEDFHESIHEANRNLKEPLSSSEVTTTIINSHTKKNYTYKCSEAPIVDFCNKKECSKRQYGVSSENISNLSFEEFKQYTTDPPYYTWAINGKELFFHTESDIIQQKKFQELCFRKLHIFPNRLKDITWNKIVNDALRNIIVVEVSEQDSISVGSTFKEFLAEFFEKRSIARNKEQLLTDRIYKDDEKKAYIFRPKNLLIFLIYQKQFREYGQSELQYKLKNLGADSIRYYISKEIGSIRAWFLPYTALEDYINDKLPEIDFSKESLYEDEEF